MTRITFDSLFAIMLAESPVITNATCDEDEFAWTAQYFDNEWGTFLQPFGHSVLVAADRDDLYKKESYHITEVNREYIRERFEEELHYELADTVIHLTERGIELVNEYLHTGSAIPSHEATYKKRARVSPEETAALERARDPVQDDEDDSDEWMPIDKDLLTDYLIHRLGTTPSQAETEFTEIVGTSAVEHKGSGSVWEPDIDGEDGSVWKAWLTKKSWKQKPQDPWRINANGEAQAPSWWPKGSEDHV